VFTVRPYVEGPSDRFSYTFARLVSYTDFVYVLCVDCDKIAVPSAWRDKVLLVVGPGRQCQPVSGHVVQPIGTLNANMT